jgi:hypothetical protein
MSLQGLDHRRHQHIDYELAGPNYELSAGSSQPGGKMVDKGMSYGLPFELDTPKSRRTGVEAFASGHAQGVPFTGKST